MKEIKFADNLRKLIKENGYSQEKFAEALGTSQGLINSYVTGKVKPGFYMLCDIAELLKVSLDSLVYGGSKNDE